MDNQSITKIYPVAPIEEQLHHPGKYLREYVDNKELTGTKAAEFLKVHQAFLSQIFGGKRSITANISLRIATVFGEYPKKWAEMQLNYDLQEAAKKVQELNLQPYNGGPK